MASGVASGCAFGAAVLGDEVLEPLDRRLARLLELVLLDADLAIETAEDRLLLLLVVQRDDRRDRVLVVARAPLIRLGLLAHGLVGGRLLRGRAAEAEARADGTWGPVRRLGAAAAAPAARAPRPRRPSVRAHRRLPAAAAGRPRAASAPRRARAGRRALRSGVGCGGRRRAWRVCAETAQRERQARERQRRQRAPTTSKIASPYSSSVAPSRHLARLPGLDAVVSDFFQLLVEELLLPRALAPAGSARGRAPPRAPPTPAR